MFSEPEKQRGITMLFIENRDYRDYRDFKENLFIKGKESSNLLKGEATRKSFKKCSVYCLFLKSLNKCRCFLLKCRVQSVCIIVLPTAASQRSPVSSAVWCPTLVSIAAVSPGWYCHSAPVVSVCWCVVMVVSVCGAAGPGH